MSGSGIDEASRAGRAVFWTSVAAIALSLVIGAGAAWTAHQRLPFGSQGYLQTIRELREAGRIDDAVRELEAEQRINRHDIHSSLMLSRILSQLGRPGSIDSLQFAADHSFDPSVHIRAAAALARVGRIEEADVELDRAILLAPRRADVRVAVGGVYLQSGRADLAQGFFREALELDPSSTEARRALQQSGAGPLEPEGGR